MNQRELALLFDLLYLPTAPFREDHIARFAIDILRRACVAFFRDPAGNIVIGAESAAEYRKLLRQPSREPLRIFVAHMDHPGFHGVRWEAGSRLAIQWHGGAPLRGLNGAKVWLADDQGYLALGNLTQPRLDKTGKRIVEARVRIANKTWRALPPALGLFGGFRDRAPVWREGRLLYTKAADDLVGVFAILHTAIKLSRARRASNLPFIGLLTRAEEVGFVGMLAHLELGWLTRARRPLLCVSLETSRTLPGADIGKGPVVRLGDRRTVFDPGYLRVLTEVAQQTLPGKHQRRIMDGGVCEATAALAYGLSAIGISVPLGNYHNESFQPASRGKPAPEYVHLDDVDGLLKLCAALAQPGLAWETPWKNTRHALHRNLQHYRRLLGAS